LRSVVRAGFVLFAASAAVAAATPGDDFVPGEEAEPLLDARCDVVPAPVPDFVPATLVPALDFVPAAVVPALDFVPAAVVPALDLGATLVPGLVLAGAGAAARATGTFFFGVPRPV
jgi:hypothetical protein